MRRGGRRRSCFSSYNRCSQKKCHVKINTTFCSFLISCTRRRCGTKREHDIDGDQPVTSSLAMFSPRTCSPSEFIGRTLHSTFGCNQASNTFFFCVCLSFLFFILFFPSLLCFLLPTCLSWFFPSCHGNPWIVCFHKARSWLLHSTHSFVFEVAYSRKLLWSPSCPSVRMYQRGSTGRISVKYYAETFMKICRGNTKLIKLR